MNQTGTNRRIALISGALGYVGTAIAIRLAQDSMAIACLYHASDKKDAEDFIKTLAGGGHRAYSCNLENNAEVTATVGQIEKEMGVPFACIHAAGTKPLRKFLLDTSAQEMERQLEINVLGSFNLISECAKLMRNKKTGVIVGLTTIGIVAPKFGQRMGGYIPTKFALQGMLAALRQELQPSGIRVYSLAPGFMSGGMNSDIPQAFVEIARQKNASQKTTTAQDVADKISYLCSDAAAADDELTHIVAEEYSHPTI